MDNAERTGHSTGHITSQMSLSDPWITRYGTSELLNQSSGPAGSDVITTSDQEVYGDPKHPITFHIGNGGAGYTGILRVLCEKYIREHGGDFRIGWVSNHSRHSQIALLAEVVQVALTYEPENEEISINEGWAVRVGRAFNDHFILVGPDVGIEARGVEAALQDIAGELAGDHSGAATRPLLFHTRGDGSATFSRETLLWRSAGVNVSGAGWIKTYALTPYKALLKAEEEKAFLLTDRATFLTAKQDGKIPSLTVHVEGGKQLLNPCAALVAAGGGGEAVDSRKAAAAFARWLSTPVAQEIIRAYGKNWTLEKPLFTVGTDDDFRERDQLSRGA